MIFKKQILSKLTTMVLLLSATAPSLAESPGSYEDNYFSKKQVHLSPQERQALSIAKHWITRDIKPFSGRNGAIKYVYGGQQTSIVCAVLQVCDLALQPGERVSSIQLGDSARWTVSPAMSGTGAGAIQHLMIKPLDVGLVTSLALTTNRRAYHIKLKSDRHQYMPLVSFVYPNDALSKWNTAERTASKSLEKEKLSSGSGVGNSSPEYLGNLSFNYDIEGDAPWKPLRVYNDGKHTIITLPKSVKQSEVPVLLVIKKDGGMFSNQKTQQVNYRLSNNRFIVDIVFRKAILVSGVGSEQKKVTITKGDNDK